MLDPDTLAVVRVQTLPWDPTAAVFSADGRYMYAAHEDGFIAQVRVADGVVRAEIQVPLPVGASAPTNIGGLAIDPTGGYLGATSFNGGGDSSVALVRVSGETLAVSNHWLSQPFPTSNCTRIAESPAFDRTTTHLFIFDRNCSAFDAYALGTGMLDESASALFDRAGGSSAYSTTVVDSRGQVWASNFASLYRTSAVDTSRKSSFPFGSDPGGLAIDSAGQLIYAFQNDPRSNGIFTLDTETGQTSRLAWNLDLVPYASVVVTAALVDRVPPAP